MKQILLRSLFALALAIAYSRVAAQDVNNIIAVFTDVPGGSKFKNAQLTVTGLKTSDPVVVWPDGIDSKMKKIFENPNLIVLQYVAGLGSTETIYLEMKNKKFLVVSVGAMSIVLPNHSTTLALYRGFIK